MFSCMGRVIWRCVCVFLLAKGPAGAAGCVRAEEDGTGGCVAEGRGRELEVVGAVWSVISWWVCVWSVSSRR